MSKKKAFVEDKPDEVPAWIVSFSDMVTLLLAFFVLLQIFAKEPDPDLFQAGQGSFKRAIAGLGIPNLLLGPDLTLTAKHRRVYWFVKKAPEEFPKNRIIDADDEKIRKVFDEIKQLIKIEASDNKHKLISSTATPIQFKPGSSQLDEMGLKFLTGFAEDIRHDLTNRKVSIRILGLCPRQGDDKQRWMLASQRARSVEKALRKALAGKLNNNQWQIESSGSGSPGQWCRTYGTSAELAHIVIAITGVREDG